MSRRERKAFRLRTKFRPRKGKGRNCGPRKGERRKKIFILELAP